MNAHVLLTDFLCRFCLEIVWTEKYLIFRVHGKLLRMPGIRL